MHVPFRVCLVQQAVSVTSFNGCSAGAMQALCEEQLKSAGDEAAAREAALQQAKAQFGCKEKAYRVCACVFLRHLWPQWLLSCPANVCRAC